MASQAGFPAQNLLLARLEPDDRDALSAQLRPVELAVGQRLEIADSEISHVYFLDSGIVSVIARLPGDRDTEVGLIGVDGMTGVCLALGDPVAPFDALVQVAGFGWKLSAKAFTDAMAARPALRERLLRFARAHAIQVAATALANGRARLEERLARWLLMLHDRLPGDRIHTTHEFLAVMLGTRRAGVTMALHRLEGRGLIRAQRGEITVVDRQGLIDLAHASYGLAERHYERLLGPMQGQHDLQGSARPASSSSA